MSPTKPVSETNLRVADRLAGAGGVRFVARQSELALFRSALAAEKPPFTVLHVHGQGGVGKTTLLREFVRLARDAHRTVVALDGRNIPPSRRGLLRALDEALAGGPATGAARVALPDRSLVLIDTYEALSTLDTWLRDTLLPDLPAGVIVVLAGRGAPALPWRTDVAWAPLTRVIELDNFAPAESVAFLESRGVARTAHANVLDFTHGHPLALSLVADVLTERPDTAGFDPKHAPDIVRHLLALFLDTVPHGQLREVLDISAVAHVTSERLLVECLGAEDGRAAFDWLRRQSFIESSQLGVFPHDLVREVLIADARWRDHEGLVRLSRRIYSILYAHIAEASGPARQRLEMDALYVTRIKPTNAAFFDWRALEDVRVEPAESDDGEWIGELTDRHEGPASAELARAWWRTQPTAFHVFRGGPDDARFGFLALLELSHADRSMIARDPAAAAALAFVERHGPTARGEAVVYLRWWMHEESYQAITAAINLTAMHVVSQCVTRPGMAWNFVAMADPSFWAAHFEGVNFARAPEADFAVGDRRYGVFAHDWRIEPPADWLMGARIPMPFSSAVEGHGGSVPALSEAAFRDAVRGALRDYTRPDRLADSPLRLARMLQAVPPGQAAIAMQGLLREAAAALKANPRDMKLYRAVWHTYFEPLESQEKVSERLNLPFSTYRHHLGRGIERMASWLWQRERAASRVQT